MKKLHKTVIVLLFAMICLVTFAGCNKLQTDDKKLKARGYIFRVTFNGDGGKSANATERMVYLKEGYPVPREGNRIVGDFVRAGYTKGTWYYNIEDDEGNMLQVDWDFDKDRVTKDHPAIVYDESEGLYKLDLYPHWTRTLAYDVVCMADNGDYMMQTFDVTETSNYAERGFATLRWEGYTFEQHYIDGVAQTGYYVDEACTQQLASFADLADKYYPESVEGKEHFRLYTRWLKGSYIFVFSPDQLLVRGENDYYTFGAETNYYLLNDIDLLGAAFTALDKYTGKIIGNGCTISNINATIVVNPQNDSSSRSLGILGALENATLKDVTFKDCTLNIEVATKTEKLNLPHNVGLLAGRVTGSLIDNVTIVNCVVNITKAIEGECDGVSYNQQSQYFGVFDTVEGGTVSRLIADNTIYDQDNLLSRDE